MKHVSSQVDGACVIDLDNLRRSCGACGLGQLCLPAGIDAGDLKKLDSIVKSRRPLDRGQDLFVSGQAFESLFVVRSGSFKTHMTNEQGETQILGFHLPGEMLGFDAVSANRHQCAAQALERASVCEVPFPHLSQIALEVRGLQHQLMRVISSEVARDHQHLVMMGKRQAQARLAIFLHSLAERYQRLQRDRALLSLSMSRQELANYLGVVVETVSRLFSKFQQMQVLEVRRKSVRILDFSALRELMEDATPDCPKTRMSA